jgi:hypothetical protein
MFAVCSPNDIESLTREEHCPTRKAAQEGRVRRLSQRPGNKFSGATD